MAGTKLCSPCLLEVMGKRVRVVGTVGTKMCDRSSQKLMFGGGLSLLQSLKGGTNESLESMVTLWDMGLQFYSKWALMQWTHSSTMTATKCKVCQYAASLWHLYCVLQELSALYWYFHTQQRMWTYAVTHHADCIRLLAGRAMNICHAVRSLSTVMQPHTAYNKHKELLRYGNLRKSIICCWCCPLDYYFWTSDTTLARSPILQQA